MPTKRVFGYCRVSSQGQNLDRQIDALKAAGVNERDIFTDKASGKDFRRQAYETMKSLLREGDELVILDLDRLGRNYSQIAEEWREITKTKGCDIVILNCPILSTKRSDNSLDTRLIADRNTPKKVLWLHYPLGVENLNAYVLLWHRPERR